ncbi:hypothetical protein DFQ27_007402 [Actinomortierella ambigua]|uniref:Uncharacterized protein n=1 Tax=Actinomortierella ambigua TaxID=1343610 RepID=A0A9P6QKC1_9FUNG|nr:hypothetical protein DFQ27_007402 [Actinomortierella ambigua]
MKLFASTLLASCVPSACLAVVHSTWAFDKIPPAGLRDITFAFNVANAPHRVGFYFAQQFNFQNISKVGYTGLQPQVDVNGNSVIRGVFSSFQNGTTTNHPNCRPGADGGPGVSCGFIFPANYNHKFNMTVQNIGNTTWRGTAVDTVTNNATEIGVWTLPPTSGGILDSQLGFVEYFPWNNGKPHNCSTLPFTEVTMFNPTSKTTGASGGKITSVYEQPNLCEHLVNFSDTLVPGGHDIKVGFL